jgi:hypothetical protein
MSANDELHRHADELTTAVGYEVELVEGGVQVPVIIKQVRLPSGHFSVTTTDMLFLADAQYPLSALDMFWVELEVMRADGGVPANADQIEQYADRSWRRFSWHRNGIWNPNGNGLLDHFEFAMDRLVREAQA